MPDDAGFRENVVVVNFPEDSKAYEAMTSVKELDSQGQLRLRAAAVVARDANGGVAVKDEVGDDGVEGTATGGILGLLIGILGGPLGVLIGGATGLLVGSLFDLEDSEQSESVLGEISASVHAGRTALLAEVREQGDEVLDAAMSRLDGEVLRFDIPLAQLEGAAPKMERDHPLHPLLVATATGALLLAHTAEHLRHWIAEHAARQDPDDAPAEKP